jgi:Zn-dependent M28 family amino/carboxypeptidase
MGVTGEAALEHLQALSDISELHAEEGYRSVGSPGYAEASAYVERVLEDTGAFDVRRDEFVVPTQTFGEVSLVVDGVPQESFSTLSNAEGTENPLTSTALTLPADDSYGDGAGGELGCKASDFTEGSAGTIVLVQRGECTFGEKVTAATAAGAAAIVVYNNVDGPLNGTVGERVEGSIPGASLGMAEGEVLRDMIAGAGDGEVLADLTVETTFEDVTTWNVIAETTAGDPENVQMMGAHLDGVAEGPGVNDNASGVAGLLAVAEALAAQDSDVDNRVRLGFWGAEEIGLVGSTRYVESLDEAELGHISSYLNYDMIGSENFVVGTLDSDGSDVPVPDGVTVPEGSSELEKIFTDFFDSVDQPHVGTEFSGRSDYQAFIDNGIPVSGLFSGADAIKTEEQVELFGGVAGVQLDRNYHTIDDTYENVSQEAIDIFVPAMAFAAHSVAFDLEPTVAVDPETVSVTDFKKSGVEVTVTNLEPGAEVPWSLEADDRTKPGRVPASGTATADADGTATFTIKGIDPSAVKGLPGAYTVTVETGGQTVQASFTVS